MKNVTITLPDDVARKAKIEAAKAGLSLSAWFRKLAQDASRKAVRAEENAWDRALNDESFDLGLKGRTPSREERNARR